MGNECSLLSQLSICAGVGQFSGGCSTGGLRFLFFHFKLISPPLSYCPFEREAAAESESESMQMLHGKNIKN